MTEPEDSRPQCYSTPDNIIPVIRIFNCQTLQLLNNAGVAFILVPHYVMYLILIILSLQPRHTSY